MSGCCESHDLSFNAERHRYTLDGRDVPAVTTICNLADAHDLLKIQASLGPAEMERRRIAGASHGAAVHAAAAAIARGIPLLPVQQSERYAASVEVLGNWFADNVSEVLACELIMASPRLWVAGTPDLIAVLKNGSRPTIIDYKTGAGVYLGNVIQQAAYRMIAKEWLGLVCNRMILHLPAPEEGKTPTVTAIPLKRHSADEAAFHAVNVLWRRSQEAVH